MTDTERSKGEAYLGEFCAEWVLDSFGKVYQSMLSSSPPDKQGLARELLALTFYCVDSVLFAIAQRALSVNDRATVATAERVREAMAAALSRRHKMDQPLLDSIEAYGHLLSVQESRSPPQRVFATLPIRSGNEDTLIGMGAANHYANTRQLAEEQLAVIVRKVSTM